MPTTINDELLRIEGAKADIATAIGGKGVTVPANAKIDDFADLIAAIQTGGGTDNTLLGIMNRTITSVDIPNGVTAVPDYFFRSCTTLATVNFPTTITSIGIQGFQYCNLATLDLRNLNNLTKLGNFSFASNANLTEIYLPYLSEIGTQCFSTCWNLEKCVMMSPNVPQTTGAHNFINTKIASGNGYIYVPIDAVNDYKSATNWSTYANQIKGWKYDANNNIVDENDNIIINSN